MGDFLENEKISLCFITESWLSERDPDENFTFNGLFTPLRVDRPGKRGGGVLVLIKKDLKFVLNPTLSLSDFNCEIISFDLFTKNLRTRFFLVYRPPNTDKVCTKNLVKFLKKAYLRNGRNIILGDFNFPDIRWDLPNMPTNENSKIFFEFTREMHLSQLVYQPTMITNSHILDLILTSDRDQITDCIATDFSLTQNDHLGVKFTLNGYPEPRMQKPSPSLNFREGDYTSLNRFFASLNWEEIFSYQNGFENALATFYEIIQDGINQFIPIFKPKKSEKSNYPLNIQKLLFKKKAILKNKNRPNWKEKLQKIHKKCRKAISQFKEKALQNRLEKGGLNALFKYFNHRKQSGIPSLSLNDQIFCDNHDKSKIFAKIFQENFQDSVDQYPNSENYNPTTSFYFDLIDVYEALEKLPNKTSKGPDQIPQLFLKKCSVSLARPLFYLFEKSLSLSIVPEIWRKSFIRPTFKRKGSPNDPSKYRPVSLTSTICRVFESLIAKYLHRHLSSHGYLSKNQFGFLPRKSCTTQLLTVLKEWLDNLALKNNVDVIYFDFEKAFDRVDHSLLIKKLYSYCFDPVVINWIKEFLSNRSYQVLIDDTLSNAFFPKSGVPQGSVLGPILFLVFINDLPNIDLADVKIKLFADDLKVFTTVNSIDDALKLQNCIDKISEWADSNHLTLAGDKTSLLRLGTSRIDYTYKLKDHDILSVPEIRDLGITIDAKLSFESHINNLSAKGSRLVFHLFKSLPKLSMELCVKLFNIYIRPIMEYGSEVFNPTKISLIKKLEKPQRTFTKILSKKFGLPYSTYVNRLIRFSMDSLEFRRSKIDLTMTYKMILGFVDIELSQFFQFPYRFNPRFHLLRVYPPSSSTMNKGFLTNRISKTWNDLPKSLDLIQNPFQFLSWLNSLPKRSILSEPVYVYYAV